MIRWQQIQNALNLLWELRHKEASDLELWVADQIEKCVQLLATTDPFIAQLYRTYEVRWERDYSYA